MRKRSGRPPRFAQVPNETVDDSLNLDLTALGLLTVFLRHKDGWDITLAKVGEKYGYGEDAMANAMGMLQIARYVVKVRIMGAGNKWRTEMAVYAPPARDAEVEELLAAIRDEDPEARRVEVIPPTVTAIKRAQKRQEKLGRTGGDRLRENPESAPTWENTASSQVIPDSGFFRDPGKPRVSKKTVIKKEDEEDKDAVGDARRASTGSSARGTRGGSAATGKTASSSKKARLSREEAAAVAVVVGAVPESLLELLAGGKVPHNFQVAVAGELGNRTPEQLADRVARRWVRKRFQSDLLTGKGIGNPYAVLQSLVRAGECPDAGCEDGEMVDTGVGCRTCEQRNADRPAPGRKGSVPAQRSGRARWECRACRNPKWREPEPEDGECQACKQEAATHCAGLAASWPAPETEEAND